MRAAGTRLTCRVDRGGMIEIWITLALLNADLLATAAAAVGEGWARLASAGARTLAGPGRQEADLTALGLDRLPSSPGDLRRAYRRAAKAAHPDAGGSADAWRAVSEAFGRLSARLGARMPPGR